MGNELTQQWEDILTTASQELLKLTIEYHKQQITDLEFKLQHKIEQINKKCDKTTANNILQQTDTLATKYTKQALSALHKPNKYLKRLKNTNTTNTPTIHSPHNTPITPICNKPPNKPKPKPLMQVHTTPHHKPTTKNVTTPTRTPQLHIPAQSQQPHYHVNHTQLSQTFQPTLTATFNNKYGISYAVIDLLTTNKSKQTRFQYKYK